MEGWRFAGVMVAKFPTSSFGARYQILVDRTFKTRSLAVERISSGKSTSTKVDFRDDAWFVDKRKRPTSVSARTSTSRRVPSPTRFRLDELV